jgi:hypothetical protein
MWSPDQMIEMRDLREACQTALLDAREAIA